LPHHKSAKKRMKTSEERRLRNRDNRAEMRSSVKKFRGLTAAGEGNSEDLRGIYSMLDMQARKGIIPRARAARLKARLSTLLPK